jgi:hypothetical protein
MSHTRSYRLAVLGLFTNRWIRQGAITTATILLLADPLLLLLILDIYITGYLVLKLLRWGWA